MASIKKKVAVLGGGVAGLFSIICLKEKGNFEPICFEKTDKPGGTWCYREEVIDGVSCTMSTTIINHSKELGAWSKYPPSKEFNNFMKHSELYQYFMNIWTSTGALKHVQYNMEIVNVRRADDYDETGRWIVTAKNTVTGEESTDIYDGVLVCTGQYTQKIMPMYKGQNLFKGEISHTHSLRETEKYRKKRVIVVGMGCSGLDAAVEISNIANQVYLSTRSGAYVIQRVGPHGLPFDYHLARRYIFLLFDILPSYALSWLLESVFMDPQFNRKLYAVKPKYHVLSKDPVINDHLASKLLSGSVIQKPDIHCFTEDGVNFEGDTEVTKADAVIMATGYVHTFPFLEDGVVIQEEGRIDLYKCVFPAQLKHGTLAIIASVLPFGPGFPVGELQIRWAVQVLAGKCKLPPPEVMLKEAKDRYDKNLKRYAPSEKMSLRIDYIPYCDDIASEIGAKPNLLKMFFTDTKLFLKLFFGPHLSYQYRLQGPHSWDGARDAIMTAEERIFYPLTKGASETDGDNIFLMTIRKFLKNLFF
ncbi:Dimethylaniline monooxygenase like protein [Argiope bruennichi]|uniref:Flavin-containing monooxygenase n=1 Tax=Argiope bruennichi TaxID=94029 RepID=A0A8T0EUK5_ARGBR|nr:Dimethylaniline monooxygenase like protein [Argiope bruennichi]